MGKVREEAEKMPIDRRHQVNALRPERKRESKTEKSLNYLLVLAAKIVALVLGVLAAGGFAIESLSIESVAGLLAASLVILTLASIQDSMAIHRYCRELDELDRTHERSQGYAQGGHTGLQAREHLHEHSQS